MIFPFEEISLATKADFTLEISQIYNKIYSRLV